MAISIQNQKGFSLIEIMVAIMILSVAFIGLIGAFPYALSIITEAKNQTQASYLAQEKIEELYQFNYSAIATGTIEARHSLATTSYAAAFSRATVVTLINQNLASTTVDYGLKKITTMVYYNNAITKKEKSYNLTAVISRRQ